MLNMYDRKLPETPSVGMVQQVDRILFIIIIANNICNQILNAKMYSYIKNSIFFTLQIIND